MLTMGIIILEQTKFRLKKLKWIGLRLLMIALLKPSQKVGVKVIILEMLVRIIKIEGDQVFLSFSI